MSEIDQRKLSAGEWIGLVSVGCGALALLLLFPILASSLRTELTQTGAIMQTTLLQRVLVSPVACVVGGLAATALFIMAARKRYTFAMRRVMATTSLLIVFIFAMTFRSAANVALRESAHVQHVR